MEHLQGLCAVLRISIDDAVKGVAHEAATGVEQALLTAIRNMDAKDAELILATALHLSKKPR